MSRRFNMLGGQSSSTVAGAPSEPDKVNLGYVFTFAALVSAACLLSLVTLYFCFGHTFQYPPVSSTNKDLKKKVLKTLPKLTYSTQTMAEKFSECAICLTEFVAGDEIRVLPKCGHCFHVTCIDTWFETQCSCPCCRKSLVVDTDRM